MNEIKLILSIIFVLALTTLVLISYIVYDEVKQCNDIRTIVEQTLDGYEFEIIE